MLASTGSATNVIVWQGVTYKVITAEDGRQWLDRNLGAKQVATASNDQDSYGWLYQWGRGNDGHQYTAWGAQPDPALSGTTSALSSSDTPGHSSFIVNSDTSPYDWRSSQNATLWQGVSGINNPCPPGFRLPTKDEWANWAAAAKVTNAATALSSSLKLPEAGYRNRSTALPTGQGSRGCYWSSSVYSGAAHYLYFDWPSANPADGNRLADGYAVRAIKN